MTMDLREFVIARLDDQEKRLNHMRMNVIQRHWCAYPYDASGWRIGVANGQDGFVIAQGMERAAAEYIARIATPDQVLADLAAKRRIIDRHSIAPAPEGASETTKEWAEKYPYCAAHRYQHQDGTVSYPIELNNCPELRDLAAPFHWHPDHRAEWRP